MLTKERTSNFERKFTSWCSQIKNISTPEQFKKFIDKNIEIEKERLSDPFDFAIKQLTETSVSKQQLKYILAKLTQYLNNMAYGSDFSLEAFMPSRKTKLEIEHILPQTTSPEVLGEFNGSDRDAKDFVGYLGNLTLLEKTINDSIQNKPFSQKREEYKKSQYLLTKTIAEKFDVGKNTSINRTLCEIHAFDVWTSESIEKRQEMLRQLARKVWEMP